MPWVLDADRVKNMAVLGVTIYKTPVSSLVKTKILADQNSNKKRNMSVARGILSFTDICLILQTDEAR